MKEQHVRKLQKPRNTQKVKDAQKPRNTQKVKDAQKPQNTQKVKDAQKPQNIQKTQSIQKVQHMIDRSVKDQRLMLEIGKAYLEGTVLKDLTAAEAWLTRAMCEEENALAVEAMELIGHHIAGKEQILTDEDYKNIREKLSDAAEGEYEYLRALESLGRKERQR